MKTKMTLSEEWRKLLGKENIGLKNVASKDADWIYEMLGWKKNARRPN